MCTQNSLVRDQFANDVEEIIRKNQFGNVHMYQDLDIILDTSRFDVELSKDDQELERFAKLVVAQFNLQVDLAAFVLDLKCWTFGNLIDFLTDDAP